MVLLIIGRENLFVIFVIYVAVMLYFVWRGSKGDKVELRKIPAIDAIDEAVARAVEMGKAVHWTEGHPRASKLYDANGVYLVASLSFLAKIARSCAEKGARLLLSVGHPELYPVVKDLTQTAYSMAGHPEAYVESDIELMPEYSYLAAVLGRITREHPAAHIQIGYFWGQDSVAIPEVAQGEGCFSINGGQVSALQYLVVLSDYVLIADELFASSAQISNDPVLIMNMVALDVDKALLIASIFLGTILSTLGIVALRQLFKA